MALSNKMKELNTNNKFRHIGPRGYKAAMPKWTKNEQELREARIPDPFEGWPGVHQKLDLGSISYR
jgi:hypothetical protein